MTTEKRKAQLSESQKRNRAKKKLEGRIGFTYMILPEWRKAIMDLIKKLEKQKD